MLFPTLNRDNTRIAYYFKIDTAMCGGGLRKTAYVEHNSSGTPPSRTASPHYSRTQLANNAG
jgi:hypothetical protein